MKRSVLLASLRKFFEEKGVLSSFEIRINSQNLKLGHITKPRSLFITGLQQNHDEQLSQLMKGHGINDFDHRFYMTLDELEQSTLIDRESSSLENNWRGRILRFGQDFTWDLDDQKFVSVFLKSYFRLIISKVNGSYFGHHDIAPVFNNPGHSTAGSDDFRSAIDSMVKFVTNGREYNRCHADPDFDYLKVFTSTGTGQSYNFINLDGNPEIQISSLFNRIDTSQESKAVDWIYNAILTSFPP